MTLKARGVRKSKGTLKSACQLLTYAEFTFTENRGFCTITEAVPIQMFTGLRTDLERLSLASYFAQVADVAAMEGEPNQELLSLTLNAIYALSVLNKPQDLVKAGFEMRAACVMGYTPDLSFCAGCGCNAPSRFSLRAGVLLCDQCAHKEADGIRMPVSGGILSALRYLTDCPAQKLLSFTLPDAALRELASVTEAYLLTQLERGFTTLDFYKSLFLFGGDPI